jgi:hypothetical protein
MAMNWNERVLTADPSMATTTPQLVDAIARFFTNSAAGTCAFYDVEPAGLIGVTSAQIREARQELVRKHFLRPIHHPGGKPRFALHCGIITNNNNGGAA